MIKYKNISFSAKTFYGMRFEPGEIKSVPGYINCQSMVRIFESKPSKSPMKTYLFDESAISHTRGRKKKSMEPEKDSIAETTEIQIETPKEETTNGNPS